jgi:transcriptional regulator with XRE-family HTH domain
VELMPGSTFEPIHLPEWAWRSDEARQILRDRSAAGILHMAQQYAGASQHRIATATGILQGRVSEVLKGNRQVSALEVFERIADGLNMPDDARVTLGLAPKLGGRAAAGLLPSSEIARVFTDQAAAADEIRDLARKAATVDVLAVRGLGLLSLNHSLLLGAITDGSRDAPLRLRVLVLDPDCAAARQRAGEIGESPESLSSGIRFTIARLGELADTGAVALEVACYDRLPIWRLIDVDSTMFVGAFAEAWEGHESPIYKLAASPAGMLHRGLHRMLEDLRQHSKRII